MSISLREQEPDLQQEPNANGLLKNQPALASLIHWLVGFIKLTEEEQENAGIYLDRLGGE